MKPKTTRIKPTPIIQSRAQMETVIGEIASAQLRANELTAEMDQQITAVRQRYEGKLDPLNQEIALKSQAAQIWADSNPEEFGEKKSIEFVHATVGFRTGTPKVLPLKKRFTVAVIIELFTRFGFQKYIRQPDPQIDKESLIADRKTLTESQLARVGLKITQDETFFIDLKATETETTLKSQAA